MRIVICENCKFRDVCDFAGRVILCPAYEEADEKIKRLKCAMKESSDCGG